LPARSSAIQRAKALFGSHASQIGEQHRWSQEAIAECEGL
jgi:hypothetical protein